MNWPAKACQPDQNKVSCAPFKSIVLKRIPLVFPGNNTPAATSRPTAQKILIATDVFGMTPAVATLARHFPYACELISPFEGQHFQSEQKAYTHFVANGGVAAYSEKIAEQLRSGQLSGNYLMALGFSAGASALWALSEQESWQNCQQMVLFYGSRIRELREIQPVCPVRLIFAEKEAAFEPKDLVRDLCQRGHQAELVRQASHGFMNSYSAGYQAKLYTQYIDQLLVSLAPPLNCRITPPALAA